LLLDNFTVHKEFMRNEFGFPIYFPANCTDKLQPVDLGIVKPFKDRIRKLYDDWLYDTVNANQLFDSKYANNAIKPSE
jgi:hypothetical protein